MSYRRIVENYYCDVNNTCDLLLKLVNAYRLLVGGADELNRIALASKNDIKKALKRADELGEIIDDVIEDLDYCIGNYTDYCKLKSKILKVRLCEKEVLLEIEEGLKLKE